MLANCWLLFLHYSVQLISFDCFQIEMQSGKEIHKQLQIHLLSKPIILNDKVFKKMDMFSKLLTGSIMLKSIKRQSHNQWFK